VEANKLKPLSYDTLNNGCPRFNSGSYFLNLPTELIDTIASFIQPSALPNFALSCKDCLKLARRYV
jgi:hypothetical protein